ncbi:hypothetical protein LYSHEL_25420 [Lysobacter helvus]|uniref:tRNA_anti-like n=2 Tax=Lysobacteraceae TaxID=32033 RepID=A0ABM7Q7Y2_9GAMM|nr:MULTISPECIES: OB-fold putative lipoprotein [Lysobacter]BCT93518.1 hypothetical protein LYSCAS_25420 [Lysobacter caseinilyticus]BCT96671.1 hypothetical protein LYSHEL_25420 [Lysobacter helvus]
MNAIAVPASNASAKAAWVCLAIAWVCFLLPIPGTGMFVGWPLNLVAFILAIVAMSKRGAMAGIFPMLASLLVSPAIYFIGLLIFAGSIAAVSDAADTTTPSTTQAQAADAISINARALQASYSANEVAADQQYKGKPLRVTGVVESIESGIADEPVVQLSGGDFSIVQAHGLLPQHAASLAKGDRITLACTGGGEIMGMPTLDDCSLL